MALLHISPSNIATLILNSPPVNTLTLPLLKQIRSSLAKLDHNTKGLVICSKFPKVVSSGLDLNYLAIKPNKDVGTQTLHLQSERLRLKEYMGLFEEVSKDILRLPFPTIATLQGHAPAGGTVLALCCDYRIASPTVKMGLTEVQVGMTPPKWVHALVNNCVGRRFGKLMLMRGEMFDAGTSFRAGLIDQMTDSKGNPVLNDYPQAHQTSVSDMMEGVGLEFEEGGRKLCNLAYWKILNEYGNLPEIAMRNVKREANSAILQTYSDQGLDDVVDSIMGKEFQRVCSSLLQKFKDERQKKLDAALVR